MPYTRDSKTRRALGLKITLEHLGFQPEEPTPPTPPTPSYPTIKKATSDTGEQGTSLIIEFGDELPDGVTLGDMVKKGDVAVFVKAEDWIKVNDLKFSGKLYTSVSSEKFGKLKFIYEGKVAHEESVVITVG